mmetsp:Transcript_62663/g.104285  ORF Transcript_62663/g.104285 Transcript_62663/m.104285 type:complete len:209 (-) Transcript_62663:693-1319(-)
MERHRLACLAGSAQHAVEMLLKHAPALSKHKRLALSRHAWRGQLINGAFRGRVVKPIHVRLRIEQVKGRLQLGCVVPRDSALMDTLLCRSKNGQHLAIGFSRLLPEHGRDKHGSDSDRHSLSCWHPHLRVDHNLVQRLEQFAVAKARVAIHARVVGEVSRHACKGCLARRADGALADGVRPLDTFDIGDDQLLQRVCPHRSHHFACWA